MMPPLHEPPSTAADGFSLALSRRCTVSRLGLRLRGEVGVAEWAAVGRRLLGVADASAWWLGDWLVFGEFSYGEKYKTVIAALNLKYDRLRDYAYVAGSVPREIRRADLTFSHHRLVAK